MPKYTANKQKYQYYIVLNDNITIIKIKKVIKKKKQQQQQLLSIVLNFQIILYSRENDKSGFV